MVTAAAALEAARRHMGGPFTWRDADCGSAACAAFADLWGFDPMGDFRGAYDGPRAALQLVRAAGGYFELIRRQLGQVGLSVTDAPQSGDLVAIAAPGPMAAALMICIQPGEFAGKGKMGMTILRGTVLGGWTCRL